MLRELKEAAQQGAKAKVDRLCVHLARNRRGVKGRRKTHVASASPSLDESRKWLESPAEEGGMSAWILIMTRRCGRFCHALSRLRLRT